MCVALERKWRIASRRDAEGVIEQAKGTAGYYKGIGRHIVGGRACRIVSVVFAEAMDPAAAISSAILESGIYILRLADMQLLEPVASPPLE